MTRYNQLVRDKTPKIIKDNGMIATTHVANDNEMFVMLQKKLKEEVWEFMIDESVEELADILEVIYAICENKWFSIEEIEKIRKEKRKEKGWFDKKIILDKVEE